MSQGKEGSAARLEPAHAPRARLKLQRDGTGRPRRQRSRRAGRARPAGRANGRRAGGVHAIRLSGQCRRIRAARARDRRASRGWRGTSPSPSPRRRASSSMVTSRTWCALDGPPQQARLKRTKSDSRIAPLRSPRPSRDIPPGEQCRRRQRAARAPTSNVSSTLAMPVTAGRRQAGAASSTARPLDVHQAAVEGPRLEAQRRRSTFGHSARPGHPCVGIASERRPLRRRWREPVARPAARIEHGRQSCPPRRRRRRCTLRRHGIEPRAAARASESTRSCRQCAAADRLGDRPASESRDRHRDGPRALCDTRSRRRRPSRPQLAPALRDWRAVDPAAVVRCRRTARTRCRRALRGSRTDPASPGARRPATSAAPAARASAGRPASRGRQAGEAHDREDQDEQAGGRERPAPPLLPAAATISGDGVSPAASAAASGIAAGQRRRDGRGASAGRAAGSFSRQRRMTRSTAGSSPASTVEGEAGCSSACLRRQLGERRGLEGLAPGEELVEHEAERVDVAPHRRAPAGELLGRHVGGRARRPRRRPCRRRRRGEAEVGDPRAAAAVEHDVAGLQVAVQDAACRAPRRGPRRAGARSRPPCPAAAARCAAAARRGPRRPRTPSRGSAGRRPRRRRRRGRRSGARPGARCAPRRRSARARRGSRGELPRAGTSARPAGRASGRRRGRPRPCRRGRAGRRSGSARRASRPGAKPPAVERRRGGDAADGPSAAPRRSAAAATDGVARPVGTWERDPTRAPQDEQNRELSRDLSRAGQALHFGVAF